MRSMFSMDGKQWIYGDVFGVTRVELGERAAVAKHTGKLCCPLGAISMTRKGKLGMASPGRFMLVVPGHDCGNSVNVESRDTSSGEFSHYRQVVLTSLPLLFADMAALVACYMVGTLVTKWLLQTPIYFPGVWNNLTAVCLCHMILGSVLGLFPASGINPVREMRNQITSISGSFLVLIALNGLIGVVTRNEVVTMLLAS